MNTHAFSLLLLGKGSIKLPKYDRNLTHFQYCIKPRCYIFFWISCLRPYFCCGSYAICVFVVFWTYIKGLHSDLWLDIRTLCLGKLSELIYTLKLYIRICIHLAAKWLIWVQQADLSEIIWETQSGKCTSIAPCYVWTL